VAFNCFNIETRPNTSYLGVPVGAGRRTLIQLFVFPKESSLPFSEVIGVGDRTLYIPKVIPLTQDVLRESAPLSLSRTFEQNFQIPQRSLTLLQSVLTKVCSCT
jgi:hypothetical protein